MTYPPSYRDCQKLFEELKQLDTFRSAQPFSRKYEIIHDLAEAQFYEAKPYFIKGLNSSDPDYRWACISALATHWQDRQIIPKLLEMAENDPDETVQEIAISALGMFKVKEAIPLLKEIIKFKGNNLFIQKIAYLALLRIGDYPAEKVLELAMQDEFSRELIDENLLEAITNSASTSSD